MISPQKRGQAAMEFLITYGWAIAAVLLTIGALAYFTGFYTKIVPSQCAVESPFVCQEFKVTGAGDIRLGIVNNALQDMGSANVTIYCNRNKSQERSVIVPFVKDKERLNGSLVSFNCPLNDPYQYQSDIFITYQLSGEQYTHVANGILRARVE